MSVERRKLLHRYEIAHQPRFVTFSCWQRLALFQNDAIKDHFAQQLATARGTLGVRLLGWVVMPEHVHMLLVPPLPKVTAAEVLATLKADFAREVMHRWRILDAPILPHLCGSDGKLHFWQRGGGYDRNVRDEHELLEKLEYMHNNPVTRGLVESPLDWPWSSVRWYADLREDTLQLDPIDEV